MNKGVKISLIVVGVIGVGVGLYFLFRKPKRNGPNITPSIEPPISRGPEKYTNNDFPLKQGSGGFRVEALQRYLNDVNYWISNKAYQDKKKARSTNNFFEGCSPQLVVDGKWGPNTTACWLKMRYTDDNVQDKEISETFYNKHIKGFER